FLHKILSLYVSVLYIKSKWYVVFKVRLFNECGISEGVFLYFLRKKNQLAIPVKTVIRSEISVIGSEKAKSSAKTISGSKTGAVFSRLI
ncbi:hypothetical protein, partial [uncultured Chryseobacterium sp.]|uniref:hypothetical protein n=1 Tax=uncultured Chryseobacterium sp. TaxID=259322 RepID=UPI00374A53AE